MLMTTSVSNSEVAGTPEAGGWTTREVKRIIRGLAGLNFVYVDLIFLVNTVFTDDVLQWC